MDKYIFTKSMKRSNPSICHNCIHARKPASKELAEEGYIGCAKHLDLCQDPRDHDVIVMSQEEAAKAMIMDLCAEAAATGWVMPCRLDSIEPAGVMVNGVLMVKRCTRCHWHEKK